MPARTCMICKKGENPLGRLRFAKSRVDGEVYCENCTPVAQSVEADPWVMQAAHPQLARPPKPSAGFVVVDCPDCRNKIDVDCATCANYGSVRIDSTMLNVYRPGRRSAPKLLHED